MKKLHLFLTNSVALSLIAKTDFSLNNAQKISKRVITDEGFLLVSGAVSRPGIYEYYVGEIPLNALPDRLKNAKPDTVVRVLYPDDEVFGKGHIETIVNKPVTWDHPPEMVNSRNVMFFQRGFVKDKVKVKNGLVTADLVIQDAELINAIQEDKYEQLSTGIDSEVDWTVGVDDSYGPFDGQVSNVKVNHIAVVSKGRAGSSVRLDNKKPNSKGKTMEKEITINGVTFTVSNQVAQAVEQLITKSKEKSDQLNTVTTELENAKKDNEKLQGKVDALEEKANDTTGLDDLVKVRQELVNNAKRLCPDVEIEGKSNEDIIKDVVVKLSNADMTDKGPEYLAGRFDAYAKTDADQDSDNDSDDAAAVLKNTHKDGDKDGGEKKRTAAEALKDRQERNKNATKPRA